VVSLGGVQVRQVGLVGWKPAKLALGQAPAQIPFKVVVIDVRGNGFSGVQVTLSDGQSQKTDSNGVATFTYPPRVAEATATLEVEGLRIVRKGPVDQTLFVDLPICGTPKLLTNTEILALAGGAALAAGGTYWKVDAMAVAGEILVGAALFTAIYRHSCVW